MISTNYDNYQAIRNNTVNFRGAGNVSNLGTVDKIFPSLKRVKIDCLPDLTKNTVMAEKGEISDTFIKKVEEVKTNEAFTDIINHSETLNEVKYLQNCVKAFAGFYGFGAAETKDFLNMLTTKNDLFSLDDYDKERIITDGLESLELNEKLSPAMQAKLDKLDEEFDSCDAAGLNMVLNKLYALEHEIKNL